MNPKVTAMPYKILIIPNEFVKKFNEDTRHLSAKSQIIIIIRIISNYHFIRLKKSSSTKSYTLSSKFFSN